MLLSEGRDKQTEHMQEKQQGRKRLRSGGEGGGREV